MRKWAEKGSEPLKAIVDPLLWKSLVEGKIKPLAEMQYSLIVELHYRWNWPSLQGICPRGKLKYRSMVTQPEAGACCSNEAHFPVLTKASRSLAVALTCDLLSAKAILHVQCHSVSTTILRVNRAEKSNSLGQRRENWSGEKDLREGQAARRTYVTVFPGPSRFTLAVSG